MGLDMGVKRISKWGTLADIPKQEAITFDVLSVAPLGEGWRRGELNPCPRRYPRKHLHVYPAISSEEPSHGPAHCRLPSVHEIDSRTGTVAPPIRQPAVHVFAASRRHCENVAVN
jgi:hypothetical protein